MLFIIVFEVSQFAVELIQVILVLLDYGLGLADSSEALAELLFLLGQQRLDRRDSLIIIVNFRSENVMSLSGYINLLVEVELDIPELGQISVVSMGDVFLFGQKFILIFDFFSEIQISLVFNAGLLSQLIQI